MILEKLMEDVENFKKLSTDEKYAAVISFCKENKKLPFYNSTNKTEFHMSRFFTLKSNELNRYKKGKASRVISKEEEKKINKIASFKANKENKLRKILKFCEKNKRTPRLSVESEKALANNLLSIQSSKKLKDSEINLLERVKKFVRKTRLQKMEELKEFCEKTGRTPKQHVTDENEKKLGEFLSSLKNLNKHKKLGKEENEQLNRILELAPKKRKYQRQEMFYRVFEYVKEHKCIPKNSIKLPLKHRELGKFYIKMKWLYVRKKLNQQDSVYFEEINEMVNVK